MFSIIKLTLVKDGIQYKEINKTPPPHTHTPDVWSLRTEPIVRAAAGRRLVMQD